MYPNSVTFDPGLLWLDDEPEPGFFGYPDDDEACVPHGNNKDTCSECRVDFERERAEYREFRAANPLLGEAREDLEDLPYGATSLLTNTAPATHQSARAGRARRARMSKIDAELAAIHAYQEKHDTCDIQQHPWQAVFGAGFDAGAALSRPVAQPGDAERLWEAIVQPWPAGGFWCVACRSWSDSRERHPHPSCPFMAALRAAEAGPGTAERWECAAPHPFGVHITGCTVVVPPRASGAEGGEGA